MSDYISRQAAIDAIKETQIYVTLDYGIGSFPVISTETALNQIVDLPAADVVEVIRCKDCKHDSYCCRSINPYGRNKMDYCSYGERRTDEV